MYQLLALHRDVLNPAGAGQTAPESAVGAVRHTEFSDGSRTRARTHTGAAANKRKRLAPVTL